MRRSKKSTRSSFAALAAFLLYPPAAAAVARFDTAEIVLRASRSFDSRQGTPNPFVDVTLTADVTSPSGRAFRVDGFFDGDGAGGPAGNVFKFRVFADETGTWSWRTTSNRSDLAGRTGSFTCAGTLDGVFRAGPVVADPQRPYAFKHREGLPVYLVGKFLDVAAPAPLRYSHTFFSEELSDSDRQAMLDRHVAMSLNKINVYLANKGDYDGVSTTPWVGTAASNDKGRFDLARWHLYERWVVRLRDSGLAAQLWFFADDSGFGDLAEADRKRLIQYGMARLSGYVNTLFTLALEWQEGWSATEVESHAQYLQQHNPWDRLVSVHGVTGNFGFPTASWADYMDVQAGNDASHDTVHSTGLFHRALAAKPLIQEEHGLGEEDGENRRKAWAAFTAGAAGLGTGAFLRPLAQFAATVPFERMVPAGSLVLAGGAYALAQPGQAYVFYLYDGGTVRVDLSAASGPLAAEWFDPRSGTFTDAGEVAGGGVLAFTAPGPGDWVLALRRSVAPQSVPSHFYTLAPCRIFDTRRGPAGPLRSGERRRFDLAGACGIPATARAVSANLAVVPAQTGHLTLWPGDQAKPRTSAVNFQAGRTRANNVTLDLGPRGSLLAEPLLADPSGTVHLLLDVNGYFE